MFEFANIHRLPRAGVDPIESPYDALRIFTFAMTAPPCNEIIVVTLDAERRGRNLLVANETIEPDTFVGVIDSIAAISAGDPHVHGLIVATVRPSGGVDYDDLDRWDEADELCEAAGIDLIEWFVLGSTISCPRELCGTGARWAA